MGTRWSLRLDKEQASAELCQRIQGIVERIDAQMSTWRGESDLMRLNMAPNETWIELPEELFAVLMIAEEVRLASGGAFDIGIGPVVTAWGFGPACGQADVAAIRNLAGHRLNASLDYDSARRRARKMADMALDLSGIAKGYAVDLMAAEMQSRGIGDFVASLDGEILARGKRPEGANWSVALEEPDPQLRAARGVISVSDQALATSGDYRHRVKCGDEWLSHTIDPRSGLPVRNNLASVTVLAADCARADAWATALMVLGETAGPIFARSRGIEAIFLIRNGAKISEVTTLTN